MLRPGPRPVLQPASDVRTRGPRLRAARRPQLLAGATSGGGGGDGGDKVAVTSAIHRRFWVSQQRGGVNLMRADRAGGWVGGGWM